jgi:hypothetical protein
MATSFGTIGEESLFEFYGMAIKSTADQVFRRYEL